MQGGAATLFSWLGRLYGAGQDQYDLRRSFDELRGLFNAAASSVVLTPRKVPADAIVWTSSYSRSDMQFYFERMGDDVFLNTYLQRGMTGRACIVDRLLDFDTIDNPVFMEEMVPRFGARYALCVLAPLDGYDDLVITLHRTRGQIPFCSSEREQLQWVADSLVGWARDYRRRQLFERERGLLSALLERDQRPRALIDGGGRVQLANGALERQIHESHPALLSAQRSLALPARQQVRWLDELKQGQAGRMAFSLADGRRLMLEWAPLPEPAGWFEVTLIDPEQEYQRQTGRLGLLYDLTQAEQEVLTLLSRGLTGAEVSRMRGVSCETGKSQIKTLLRKTHTSNQNELLNLLFNLSC